jgi:hypothetical protein
MIGSEKRRQADCRDSDRSVNHERAKMTKAFAKVQGKSHSSLSSHDSERRKKMKKKQAAHSNLVKFDANYNNPTSHQ